jgi:hypothetical protein
MVQDYCIGEIIAYNGIEAMQEAKKYLEPKYVITRVKLIHRHKVLYQKQSFKGKYLVYGHLRIYKK